MHEINFADIKEKIAPAVDDMLQDGKGVDSIFFATNTLAVYGLKYLETINCTVGEDVSVVSFDEGEKDSDLTGEKYNFSTTGFGI